MSLYKNLQNNNGLTLVEVMASIIIAVIIGLLSFTLFFKAIENYDAIELENKLRDEADLIMNLLIKNLYSAKETDFCRSFDTNNNSYLTFANSSNLCKVPISPGSSITKDNNVANLNKIGFISNQNKINLIINDELYKFSTENIELLPSKIEVENRSTVKILFTLQTSKKRGNTAIKRSLDFENVIPLIPNSNS